MLDTTLVKSIMVESIYITLKCIEMEGIGLQVDGMKCRQVDFTANEKDFDMEVCHNDLDMLELIGQQRQMNF